MLIEFRVENHRSLRDEQVLTLEAKRGEADDDRLRSCETHEAQVLPAAALYGANASGKSNVLSAIQFMREAVVSSQRLWDPNGTIPRLPFGWGCKRNEPSMYEVTFADDEAKYEYGFVISDEVVQEEWLFSYTGKKKQAWFERDGLDFKFSDHLKGPNKVIEEVTRANALFLSVASQHKHQQLAKVYSWFRDVVTLKSDRTYYFPVGPEVFLMGAPSAYTQLTFFDSADTEAITTHVRKLFKTADIGIHNVKVIESEESPKRSPYKRRVIFQHQPNDDDSWLDFSQESQGTQTLFNMAFPMLKTLKSGGVLIVDELESSLHPALGETIVRLFNDRATNPKNAQLIFSTHDTNLLGTSVCERPLRRDQIWLTEKNKEGATSLYPLTDFKPRKAENLERGYLQGRYGAIPFLGDFSWVTEQT